MFCQYMYVLRCLRIFSKTEGNPIFIELSHRGLASIASLLFKIHIKILCTNVPFSPLVVNHKNIIKSAAFTKTMPC